LRAGGFLIGQVGDGETNTSSLVVPEGTPRVKLTLVWDDPAALENAAVALVNDLDLVVLDPLGTRRYPWTLDPANPAAPATRDREDHLNVVEQVLADGGRRCPGGGVVGSSGRRAGGRQRPAKVLARLQSCDDSHAAGSGHRCTRVP